MKTTGKVLWFDIKKGYGFIKADSGEEYFVHYSKIIAEVGEFRLLNEGETVEFEPMIVERDGVTKSQAKDVKVIGRVYEDSRKN